MIRILILKHKCVSISQYGNIGVNGILLDLFGLTRYVMVWFITVIPLHCGISKCRSMVPAHDIIVL